MKHDLELDVWKMGWRKYNLVLELLWTKGEKERTKRGAG